MNITASYLAVLLIWSTTPLAIAWSGMHGQFLFGVLARMVLALLLLLALAPLFGLRLNLTRDGRNTYLVSGLSVFIAMTCVYWAAQRIPSGWISVIFGFSPIATALWESILRHGEGVSGRRVVGGLLGLLGLGVVFAQGASMGQGVVLGVLAMVLSATTHSGAAVWIKRHGTESHGMKMTLGTLAVAVPLWALLWLAAGASVPAQAETRQLGAIVYLGVIGSVVGFSLYFWTLRQLSAGRMALLTLVTPIIALFLGHELNGEPLTGRVWLGTGLILAGIALFELPVARLLQARALRR